MDTAKRVKELAEERNLSMYQLAQTCGVSYSTLKNAEDRGSQLSLDTVERLCAGLGITMAEFFIAPGQKWWGMNPAEEQAWTEMTDEQKAEQLLRRMKILLSLYMETGAITEAAHDVMVKMLTDGDVFILYSCPHTGCCTQDCGK